MAADTLWSSGAAVDWLIFFWGCRSLQVPWEVGGYGWLLCMDG